MEQPLTRVIDDIDALIDDLTQPLSALDRAAGWDDAVRVEWRQHFEELRVRLARGEAPEDEQYHLMRWLNPIGTGPLARQISAIQLQLWDLFADDEARLDADDTFTGREARKILRELGVEQQPSRLRALMERLANRSRSASE